MIVQMIAVLLLSCVNLSVYGMDLTRASATPSVGTDADSVYSDTCYTEQQTILLLSIQDLVETLQRYRLHSIYPIDLYSNEYFEFGVVYTEFNKLYKFRIFDNQDIILKGTGCYKFKGTLNENGTVNPGVFYLTSRIFYTKKIKWGNVIKLFAQGLKDNELAADFLQYIRQFFRLVNNYNWVINECRRLLLYGTDEEIAAMHAFFVSFLDVGGLYAREFTQNCLQGIYYTIQSVDLDGVLNVFLMQLKQDCVYNIADFLQHLYASMNSLNEVIENKEEIAIKIVKLLEGYSLSDHGFFVNYNKRCKLALISQWMCLKNFFTTGQLGTLENLQYELMGIECIVS